MKLTQEKYSEAKKIIGSIKDGSRIKQLGMYLLENPGKNYTSHLVREMNIDRDALSRAIYSLRTKGLGIKSEPKSVHPYYQLTMTSQDNTPSIQNPSQSGVDTSCGLSFVKKANPYKPNVLLPQWRA